MDTRNILEALRRNTFAPPYESALNKAYQEEVDNGNFFDLESDYTNGKTYLTEHLATDQLTMLQTMEEAYHENRKYASEHSFYCGLMCAFEQARASDSVRLYTYENTIEDGLETAAGSERHPAYHNRSQKVLQIVEALEGATDEDTQYHITSICCAWDQRIHSATIHSFYLGYCAGVGLVERVDLRAALNMIEQRLKTEYDLGLIDFYERRKCSGNIKEAC